MKTFAVEIIWTGQTTYRLQGKTEDEVDLEVHDLLWSGGIGLKPSGLEPEGQDVAWVGYEILETEEEG